MVCEAETEFPQASVADHVRTTVKLFGQPPATVFSVKLTTKFWLQLSVAVTVGAGGTLPDPLQSDVSSAGTPTKTGFSVSVTVTVCEAVAELPQASVAVQVRVKILPQAAGVSTSFIEIIGFASQLSVAKTVGATSTIPQLTVSS